MKKWVGFILVFTWVGALAQGPYTIVFLNNKPDKAELPKEQVATIMEGHLANIKRLAKEGKLLAAGPFDGGGGIFIMNSGSIEEVETLLQTDPGVQAKRWNVEILPYKPLVGGVCPVGEKYEMTSYHVVRFWPEIRKYNVGDAPQLSHQHAPYWKEHHQKNPVIAFSRFDESGSILVSSMPISEETIASDPSVKGGLMKYEIKKLWIAKGSFCEK